MFLHAFNGWKTRENDKLHTISQPGLFFLVFKNLFILHSGIYYTEM